MAQLYGGSLFDFAGSLADEIEDAFRDVRLEAGLAPPPRGRGRPDALHRHRPRSRRAPEEEPGRVRHPRRRDAPGRHPSRHQGAPRERATSTTRSRVDARGRAATAAEDDHVRDLIMQVLFTSPGERVNRPEFGCGLKSLVFMPNSTALAAATQALVKGALQKWLEREIHVEDVAIEARDERLEVTVAYRRRGGRGAARRDASRCPRDPREHARTSSATDERARRAALLGHPTLNGIDFLEVDAADPTPAARPLPERAAARRVRARRPSCERIAVEGGTRIVGVRALSGRRAPRRGMLDVRVDRVGDFSPVRARLEADELDPRFRRITFSFRPGCPVDVAPTPGGRRRRARPRARRSTTWPRTTRASAAPARPRAAAQPALRGAEPGRPRRRARRAPRLRRRPALVLPGRGRERGVPRDGAPRGSRCAATRASSTTACTRARTRRPSSTSPSARAARRPRSCPRARRWSRRIVAPLPTARSRRRARSLDPARSRPSASEADPALAGAAVFETSGRRECFEVNNEVRSTPGATRSAGSRRARPRRGSTRTPGGVATPCGRSCRRATCCCSRRRAGRRPGSRPTPTRRAGRWSSSSRRAGRRRRALRGHAPRRRAAAPRHGRPTRCRSCTSAGAARTRSASRSALSRRDAELGLLREPHARAREPRRRRPRPLDRRGDARAARARRATRFRLRLDRGPLTIVGASGARRSSCTWLAEGRRPGALAPRAGPPRQPALRRADFVAEPGRRRARRPALRRRRVRPLDRRRDRDRRRTYRVGNGSGRQRRRRRRSPTSRSPPAVPTSLDRGRCGTRSRRSAGPIRSRSSRRACARPRRSGPSSSAPSPRRTGRARRRDAAGRPGRRRALPLDGQLVRGRRRASIPGSPADLVTGARRPDPPPAGVRARARARGSSGTGSPATTCAARADVRPARARGRDLRRARPLPRRRRRRRRRRRSRRARSRADAAASSTRRTSPSANAVHLSRIYAAVEAVAGVDTARRARVPPLRAREDAGELASGVLPLGRGEIAQLENDPSFLEHGVLRVVTLGGKA